MKELMPVNPFFTALKSALQRLNVSSDTSRKHSPDELLGELFQDVQLQRVYRDGMTFVDLVPADKLSKILEQYTVQRQAPGFNLHAFVEKYFRQYLDRTPSYQTNPNHSIEQHIDELWDVLTRESYEDKGSLISLPYPYVVPGGRFTAQWYWDSYFTMLGLAAAGRWDLVDGMIKNFAYMIRKFGHIPTGNRTYYLSRSQPPFFSHMVRLMVKKRGRRMLAWYLPYMRREYRFWMNGVSKLDDQQTAYRRVVRMPEGEILNRYFDSRSTPRPESYREDMETVAEATNRRPSKVCTDLRAGAESGWDFSSRWLEDGQTMKTIHTTDIMPVDLNCLLVQLELTIADAYDFLKQTRFAERYRRRAARRQAAIEKYCWNEEKGFYFDYDFTNHTQTSIYSLAGVFPLFAGIASPEQAKRVARELEKDFLREGGLVTTLSTTGQQWDSPNGWAPLHWITIKGLRKYGEDELANKIKERWIGVNTRIFNEHYKLVEKYNVVAPELSAGGGEYPLQDGFGWTNGVLLALLKEPRK
jgi:alpha,alpha-trehalase